MAKKNVMTPEKFIEIRKVTPKGISKNGKSVIYETSQYHLKKDKVTKKTYKVPIEGGKAKEIDSAKRFLKNERVNQDKLRLFSESVQVEKIKGNDTYPDAPKSDVQIYDTLNYRHWDTWHDGTFNHVFYAPVGKKKQKVDIMADEPFDCPMKPFGDESDFIWSPDGKKIIYVCKKLSGVAYATSTDSNLYEYDLATKKTKNLTADNHGYDTNPAFSSQGDLAWLRMKNDGYESDKNDIVVKLDDRIVNLTESWDGTVLSFHWHEDGKTIYFVAPIGGTIQLFSVNLSENKQSAEITQLTDGQFDVTEIVGQVGKRIVIGRCDINHAAELFVVNLQNGKIKQLTHENDKLFKSLALGDVKKRIVKTTDDKDMVCWVCYPPNFYPNKKYPTLLYCQGGPQAAVSQFYSTRWNFQIMAAHGYIVIAPNRRGMPGHGVEWNEQISKDYGGQNMRDYLSAIDDIAKEKYVDSGRLGAVGASYGGFSVFYLAGHHQKRFKSFIAHDGIFNWTSMYGTTEEMFFVNWDLGGAYWETDNVDAQKAFKEFNPINYVQNWDTPILIIQGGKDFRVPIGQGFEAFQAAQLQDIKSRILYFPEENHWVLQPQNALVWQREFFKWLSETL